MSQFYTLLTATGQELLTQAMGFGQQLELTHMAVGDGNGNPAAPTESQQDLVNEVHRAGLSSLVVDPENPNWLVAELVIPTSVGGWTIREIGLFDVHGNLFAVGNFPETYKPTLAAGSGREITVRMTIQVSDTAAITLTVDQSVVFATRTFVTQSMAQHAESRDHPDATTTAKGFVQLANTTVATAGQNTTRALTPAGGKALVDKTLEGYGSTVDSRLADLAGRIRLKSYFMGQN